MAQIAHVVHHEWWVKKTVLPLFERGKDLEVRVYDGFHQARPEDFITFNGRLQRVVVAVRPYPNFEAMLAQEDYRRIHPGVSSSDELLVMLREVYPPRLEKRGVLVFELT